MRKKKPGKEVLTVNGMGLNFKESLLQDPQSSVKSGHIQ